jgi:hypothetical protein
MDGNVVDVDRQALEALVVDNPELERLEALLDQFNIFEAVGVVRQELRHSHFLAFLLSPQQPHGLGDHFARRLLQRVLAQAGDSSLPISPLDLGLWELDGMEVRREWRNIDILLLDERNRLAVIIENKVDSSEHSEQLQRYWTIVTQHYPGYRILGLFLTPEGDLPSDERYLPVDYALVHTLIRQLVEARASTLGPDVATLVTHYAQMLERHIMTESEIAELCRRIYRKHQRAMDLILEHRPDLQEEVREVLEGLVAETESLYLDTSSKSRVRFYPGGWDAPALLASEGWTPSGRILLFTFHNSPDNLKISLVLGPGPQEIREHLYEIAQRSSPLRAVGALARKYKRIYSRGLLGKADFEDADIGDLEPKISAGWQRFRDQDLPKIKVIIANDAWIREWRGGGEGVV